MKRIFVVVPAFFFLAAAPVFGQPAINAGGILNVASYALPGLPNSSIAQGSIFAIFGANIGPATGVQVSAFPLQTSFQGVSISVSQGTTAVAAIPVYVSAGQVNAVMPSNAPIGTDSITLTYQGQTSAAQPVQVVAASFGIFAVNQAGSGQGVFTDGANQANSYTLAANPGEILNLWGTGLGAISGPDNMPPAAGNVGSAPSVYVGGVLVKPTYYGRSPCCSGVDQIQIRIPSNVAGCNIPVAVQDGDVVSNFVNIAVAASGTTCSDPGGLPISLLSKLAGSGSFSLGVVTLSGKTKIGGPSAGPAGNDESATFEKITYNGFNVANFGGFQTAGTCTVYNFAGLQVPSIVGAIQATGLDAGAQITFSSGNAQGQMSLVSTGNYDAQAALAPGTYSITGPGGKDVGPFNFSLNLVGTSFTWTNAASITTIQRANGLKVTWTGADPGSTVTIAGGSLGGPDLNNPVGAIFLCTAPPGAGQFTVPPVILLALPPSANFGPGGLGGILQLSDTSQPVLFSATGLDVGVATSASNIVDKQPVNFQ